MNLTQWSAGGLLAVCLLDGCSNPKSPQAQAQDVAATEEVAAREKAAAAQGVKLATADGDRKVALEKCEALTGADLKTCKDTAEADYAAAKQDAKATATPARP